MGWMEEFSRILRPGGVLALTTRSRDFLAYCETLGERDPSIHYHVALSTMFDDFDEARRQYDSGNFVHSNNSGLNSDEVRTADFCGETFIPEQYARTAYSQWFKLENFLYAPERQSHPILFFRKR